MTSSVAGVGATRSSKSRKVRRWRGSTAVKRRATLTVFVNSANDFADQPKVANVASNLMVEVFGDAGKYARSAVGINLLPLNVMVEVEGTFEIA